MLKKDLRIHFLEKRKSAPQSALQQVGFQLSQHAKNLPIWDLSVYHIFLQSVKKNEIDTTAIIDLLREENKEIVVPKISADFHLQHFHLLKDTVLENNPWGIPEPVNGIPVPPLKIDVVFVPLLAFDRKGHRVGYGKGYYDRFLSECRKDCLKVGLSLFEAVEEISDTGKQDIPMNYCLTPERIYSF
ncbi:5-formyltetrahydrofolate cyclo-ligase [Muriicola jejuensis]|uniref:5-formyltetrahydrofolate cyclo-ligase n=1 Tax=Muriicola jejuensis TaxID=504488 RepID=A0A6P0UAW9_9FLAO|nr:5-formyltetrahydrofolate cyclo-ligase [Muriicola jejuensis]NER10187.1 5-formyltetrahydrofolate cyclo-ligase [Muriicola jejuensis]SMP02376.1 5-formyltetrahydrofolate cyclo-ligase [Muriicola jejuensis]